jgi:hypothetical protein
MTIGGLIVSLEKGRGAFGMSFALPVSMSAASDALKARTENFAVAKLAIVSEEADESELWLRIIRRTGLQAATAIGPLEQEAHELASIFTASLRTARGQRKRPAGPSAPPNPPIDNLQSDNNP